MLPERTDYLATTSEFENIKPRLLVLSDLSCRGGDGRPWLRGTYRIVLRK